MKIRVYLHCSCHQDCEINFVFRWILPEFLPLYWRLNQLSRGPDTHKTAKFIAPSQTRSWAFNSSSSNICIFRTFVGSSTSILICSFQTGVFAPLLSVFVFYFVYPILSSANGSILPNISVSRSRFASTTNISRTPPLLIDSCYLLEALSLSLYCWLAF